MRQLWPRTLHRALHRTRHRALRRPPAAGGGPHPRLAGFTLGERGTHTATRSEWTARAPEGDLVMLRARMLSASHAAALAQRLEALARAPHPGLLRVHAVAREAERVTYAVDAPGVDAGAWLGAYGSLSPGQLERVVCAGARVLHHLHSRGAVAGPIAPSRVVLDAVGSVRLDLTDIPPGRPAAHDDVAALAELVARLGAGTVGASAAPPSPDVIDEELARALDAACGPVPQRPRPEALALLADAAVRRRADRERHVVGPSAPDGAETALVDLAAAAVRAHVLAGPTLVSTRPRARWQRVARIGAVLAAAGAVGITAAVTFGLDQPMGPGEHHATAANAATAPRQPIQVVLARRDAALAAADTPALAAAVVPGSAAWSRDVALVTRIRSSQVRLVGLRSVVVPDGEHELVRQLAHVRLVAGLPQLVGQQPAHCLDVVTDPRGRLATVTSCES